VKEVYSCEAFAVLKSSGMQGLYIYYYRPIFIRWERVSLRLFFNLCFFIFFLRFRFVLSSITSTHSRSISCLSSARPDSNSTSNPSRRRVFSHETVEPTRVMTSARPSCRAASASDSGEASGGSSNVPKCKGGGGACSVLGASCENSELCGGGGGSKITEDGCERRSKGRCSEKNWCSL